MKLAMRRSRVLQKLRAGEVVSCFKNNLDSARTVEIAALSGFDCVWIDTEHVASDWSLIERQINAGKMHNTDVLVRVARGAYSDLVRPLELDATGIMVPHVMSLADAQNIVHQTRFHPVGRRPLDGGNADGGYCLLDFADYIEQANRERFTILQIEDPEPLAELEDIAALDGFDMLFFGPGDFSHAIGAPAQWDHPLIHETRQRIADVCAKHGKFAGTVGSAASLQELTSMGYHFVSAAADVVGLGAYCAQMLDAYGTVADAAAPKAKGAYS